MHNKMDATVDDFLNEINEIVPPVATVVELKQKAENPWQECFDEGTGFPYYWHMHTNKVTWEMPPEYKTWLNAKAKKKEVSRVQISPPKINTNGKVSAKKPGSDSEDEKIVLISSYGGDTESEESDDEAENNGSNGIVVLTQNTLKPPPTNTKSVSGFSLLANYADDDEDEDEDEEDAHQESVETPTELKPEAKETPTEAHSTLFPIVEPIDVMQFSEPVLEVKSTEVEVDDVDSKAFQRKRRIAVDVVNTKRPRNKSVDDVPAEITTTAPTSSVKFPKIAFIKSDVLNPKVENDDLREMLQEKLMFLSEGHSPANAVQVMLIQLETLYEALKAGGLTASYLNNWLNDTKAELVKLEADAAPSGWLLEWDREQKRYYYRNQSTQCCQWVYPQQAATEDDAMDICTTPPPPPLPIEEETSSKEATPSPPPPPVISEVEDTTESKTHTVELPTSALTQVAHNQPLPPGVDNVEPKDQSKIASKDLNTVLTSFYSDIAAIESSNTTVEPSVIEKVTGEEVVKKKKKVKLSQSISMKNKNVSKLVEKWKSVQKDL